jgi:hypothetical protein
MDKIQKLELEECIADIEATLHSIYNYKDKYSVDGFDTVELYHLNLIQAYTESLKQFLKAKRENE